MIRITRRGALWSLGASSFVVAWFIVACVTQGTGAAPDAATATATTSEPLPAPPPVETSPAASSGPAPPPAASSASTAPAPPPAPTPTAAPPRNPVKSPPRTEKECKACNGEWGIHGLAQTPSCNCRTTDAGKRCKDGNDCQGLCVAADTPEREVVEKGPPARGFFVGRCSKFSTVFGCYRSIDDGASAHPVDLTEAPQMICAD